MSASTRGCSWISFSMKCAKPPLSADCAAEGMSCHARRTARPPASRTRTSSSDSQPASPSSRYITSSASPASASASDAAYTASPARPSSSGLPRRANHRRSGSRSTMATMAWAPSSRRTSSAQAVSASRSRIASLSSHGMTSLSVSERKRTPRPSSSCRSA